MKKNLLTAALVVGVLAPLSAQWTQTGGTVKVMPETLKYVSQAQNITEGKESNEGNVYVGGNFTVNSSNSNPTEFRNEFNSSTSYGQLKIAQDKTATGNIVNEYGTPGKSAGWSYIKLAIPFTGVTAQQIAEQGGIADYNWEGYTKSAYTFDPNRYKNPIFVWNNSEIALENLSKDAVIATGSSTTSPTHYYAINNYSADLPNRLSNFSGTPANGSHTLALNDYNISGTHSGSRNKYGEMYGSYLTDPFVRVIPRWTTNVGVTRPTGFGENLFTFGNPYTSNINIRAILDNLGTSGVLKGVVQQQGSWFDHTITDGNSTQTSISQLQVTWVGGGGSNQYSGDIMELSQVRPFHTFLIKTNDGTNANITLDDGVKVFDVTSDAPDYAGTYSRSAVGNTNSGVKQLRIRFNNKDGQEINRTYIVAADVFEAAGAAGNEGYNNSLANNVPAIYTLQEAADGTVDAKLANNKMYINGINDTKYVGLPVYVVNQIIKPQDYSFKFELSDALINSNDKFYFEDRTNGDVIEITNDFSYNFSAENTTKDRFAVYWNDRPQTSLGVIDIKNGSQTIVFKDLGLFKVRFSDQWKAADVYVYNMLGQLVHAKKGVDTSSDYILPLQNASATYVVKTVGDNGEVITKKIVK